MEPWIGRVLSKVRIERLIGRGGMADVYLGRHTTLNRPMAVKLLHAHMTLDSDLRRRFRDEAQAVAALRHPNIVQVNDFDVIDERPYIVMELLEGMAFSDYLSSLHGLGRSLPLETVGRLMVSLTSALDYAHQRGIVHRDVKPANIILRAGRQPIDPGAPLAADVEPVLTDFGVARIATSTTPTASGTILGTPAYMSPEQVRGEAVDARSDIYSLGVILYEILAGKLPFDPTTDTPASILYKHVHEDPPVLLGVSPAIRKIVENSLAKDPEDRFARAGLMATELQAAISALPSAEAQELRHTQVLLASAQASTPWAGRRSVGRTVGIGLGIMLAVGVLGAGAVLGSRMVRQASQATRQPTSASSAPSDSTQGIAPTATFGSPASTPSEVEPAGYAFVRDSSVVLRLANVPPPQQGYAYQVWLTAADQEQALNLNRDGNVEWIGGELDVDYTSPESLNLAGTYDQLVVSLEGTGGLLLGPTQTLFEGQLGADTVAALRLEIEVYGDQSSIEQLTDHLVVQTGHFAAHAGFALTAIGDQDLVAAKLHSEHVINIIEGREGEFFMDWDLNGVAQNPGDPVGLLPYLRLLQAAAQGAEQAEIARGRTGETAASVAQRAAELAEQSQAARETAKQICAADSVPGIQQARLDAQLIEALGLQAQIEQLAADAAGLDLAYSIPVSVP